MFKRSFLHLFNYLGIMQGMAMFFISTAFSKPNLHTYVLNFFLARPAQDVFLLPLVP